MNYDEEYALMPVSIVVVIGNLRLVALFAAGDGFSLT